MAYSVDHITLIEAWTLASEFADDGSMDVDNTDCMTNGTTGEDCDEIKEGTLCLRIVIDIPPADITSLSMRFYFNSVMTAGNNTVVPYSDANSVNSAIKDEQDYTTPGVWVVHDCDAMLTNLGDVGGTSIFRFVSEGGAKTKIGEVNIDMVWIGYKIEGVTYDEAGDPLGSCICDLYRNNGDGSFTYLESQSSNASTGAYLFGSQNSGTYRIVSHKVDAPDVFDVTDDLTAVSEA